MKSENVSHLPDWLERMTKGLRADFHNAAESDTAWIDYMVAAAIKTAAVREYFKKDDVKFGQWWKEQKFPISNANDRAALVTMCAEPELMRTVFSETDSRSVQLVYQQHKGRFTNASKPPGKKRGRPAGSGKKNSGDKKSRRVVSPPVAKAREAIRADIEAGRPISREKVAKELGVGPRDVQDADMLERGRLDGLHEAQEEAIVDRIALSLTAQQKIGAVLKRERGNLAAAHAERVAKLDEEVRLRVLKESESYLADLKDMQNKAQANEEWYRELINDHESVFTVDEHTSILRCLHPDSRNTVSVERLTAAFNLFNSRKLKLTGQK
jgi:hypothetical protein